MLLVAQYWDTNGDTTMADNVIRLTPDEPGKKGGIWAKEPITLSSWDADMAVIIGKDTFSMGADGMAFWVTTERNIPGNMLGLSPFSLLHTSRASP